jgi:hypothetical protein
MGHTRVCLFPAFGKNIRLRLSLSFSALALKKDDEKEEFAEGVTLIMGHTRFCLFSAFGKISPPYIAPGFSALTLKRRTKIKICRRRNLQIWYKTCTPLKKKTKLDHFCNEMTKIHILFPSVSVSSSIFADFFRNFIFIIIKNHA